MKNVISAIVALVVGAAGGYFYGQKDVGMMQGALETANQSAEMAEQKAADAAGALEAAKEEAMTSMKSLEDQLAAAKQEAADSMGMVSDLKARVQELEAAAQSSQ